MPECNYFSYGVFRGLRTFVQSFRTICSDSKNAKDMPEILNEGSFRRLPTKLLIFKPLYIIFVENVFLHRKYVLFCQNKNHKSALVCGYVPLYSVKTPVNNPILSIAKPVQPKCRNPFYRIHHNAFFRKCSGAFVIHSTGKFSV
jgi:hypothetical protein